MKHMQEFKVAIGDRVRDRVTGLTGIVTCLSIFFNQCQRAGVQAPMDKDGKVPDSTYVDVDQLEVLADQAIPPKTDPATGGPMPAPRGVSQPRG